jgi:DNA modification methylase
MIDIVRSHLTGAEATAYAIADNRTAELAEWDEESLAQQLAALQIEDEELLAATGFDEKELEAMSGPAEVEEDEVPEPPVDPITKPGDLWILGEHRLLCGDSTNADDVERLMAGAKAGMMVTDPPYGVNYDPEMRSTAKSVGKIANDDRASWLDAWSLFSGDVAYVWHASLFTSVVLADLESAGLRHVSMIIWKKPYATFSMANYHWQHEPCWYCVRPSGRRNWIGSPKESTVWDMTQPKDPYGRSGEDKTPHPTQKPVEAMARPMRNHDHQIVYDPFLGSGTTLIAAEQLGRKCYGMEISPAYCDVIVKRWETLTGKKAERGA